MSKLMDKMLKSTKIKGADILEDSKLFSEKEVIQTDIPAINIALSGDIDGGLRPGLTSIAGNSRHFKTSYALLMAAAYLKKHQDSMLLYYDSEFGAGDGAMKSFGIDPNRVLHIPITNIEEFKFDIMGKLDNKNEDGIKRGDKVFILVDSIGNLLYTTIVGFLLESEKTYIKSIGFEINEISNGYNQIVFRENIKNKNHTG